MSNLSEAQGSNVMPGRLLIAVSLLFSTSHVAKADQCLVCDSEIILTASLAECFVGLAPTILAEMDSQGTDYNLVNLGTCSAVVGDTRGADDQADSTRQLLSWSSIKDATENTVPQITTTFIMNRSGIKCLAERIAKEPSSFDPSAAFRPAEMCP
jgi:hypothetical protein